MSIILSDVQGQAVKTLVERQVALTKEAERLAAEARQINAALADVVGMMVREHNPDAEGGYDVALRDGRWVLEPRAEAEK